MQQNALIEVFAPQKNCWVA